MKAPEAILLHADRLDWCYWSWPVRDTPEFSGLFELFDRGNFGAADLFGRFCCIDFKSGLVTVKNDTIQAFYRASHTDIDERETQTLVDRLVQPFAGWALTWNPTSFPGQLPEVLQILGVFEEKWRGGASTFTRVNRGRPRKLDRALVAYREIYPDGHDSSGDTWKVVAARTSEHLGLVVSVDTIRRGLGKKK